MANEPIEPLPYLAGPSVVDIGDIRVARGLTRRPVSACKHKHLTYDPRERRIWCQDCETDVDPFDGFVHLVEQWNAAHSEINRRADAVAQAEKHELRSIAAKVIDKEWRRANSIPVCPMCRHGLFPEDFKRGIDTMGREYAMRRRDAELRRRQEKETK